ncbi:hypothetical protein LNAOJCKE_4112 [Methylorubrum aminovorans]|uniref:Uncharacterized protein n=1 Tax=Methylorubrum aminovorans TaxID=269069 RepID=A0ABQ4UIR4_9HYPH|nr:hypothetical protein [Methylorubrum aminovorans]GJE66888.1 hypothetical protein LNAOJCKE_4112 [Methylorubrum aminovorans]GMA74901.1 hypothetical protein GCM10025880_13180 [Methylorubrum aminovorans]
MSISAVLRELMAAGLQGEALIAAVERIEDVGDQEKRQTRAARNKRYKERLKARKAADAAEAADEPGDKTLKTSKTSYEGSPKTKASPDPSKNPTPLPPGDGAPTSAKKGHRLPDNFRVSPAGRSFARNAGWTDAEIDEAEAEFVDH